MKKIPCLTNFEFELLRQKIVVTTEEEAKLAQSAIQVASKKVDQLREKHPKLSDHQIAVLALLEISGDLIRDRKKVVQYQAELDQRCNDLLLNLNQLSSTSQNSTFTSA